MGLISIFDKIAFLFMQLASMQSLCKPTLVEYHAHTYAADG